jgi:O-acetyl-ADP-ribose deacetylase (regulator of RNase III)
VDVKIFLRDLSEPIIDAWCTVFDDYSDVEISCGDILDLKADAIISPANSFGFMDGGIDFAYSRYFGWDLQRRLQKLIRDEYYGELPVGNAVILETKNEEIRHLISAPTMRVPQDISGTLNVYLAFRAALIEVKEFNKENNNKIKSVLCPGLGTLTGAMLPMDCAIQMKKAYDSILRGVPPFPNSLSEAYGII